MDNKERLFEEFIKANDLQSIVDFSTRRKKFTGLGPIPLTAEELMGTAEYAGFIDGYQGNPRRFEDAAAREMIEGVREAFATLGIEPLLQFSGDQEERYLHQYSLGRQNRNPWIE